MKCSLASLLVGGSFDSDLVACHNLLHDFTEGSGFAISACRRKVDRRQGKRLCRLRGVRCDARASGGTPSQGDRLGNGNRRGSKGWKCLLRVGIEGGNDPWPRDRDRNCLRRERVWGTFEMVQSLRREISAL
jgi:hypothetical protein